MIRRRFLLGASSIAILIKSGSSAFSQSEDGAASFRETFGMPNYRAPSDSLRFLSGAQDARVAVPFNIQEFSAYLDRLPIIVQMKKETTPEIYHLLQWNALALDLTSLDHATVQTEKGPDGKPIPDPLYAEQIGPCRTSRALAIAHLAIFEAVNAIYRRAESYQNVQTDIFNELKLKPEDVTAITTSVRAAIAVAANDTLLALFPQKRIFIDLTMRKIMPLIGDQPEMIKIGVAIGAAASRQVLTRRKYNPATGQFLDGSESDGNGGTLVRGPNNSLDLEPLAATLFPSPGKADWRVDPITEVPKAIGGYWKYVEPFALDANSLFLPSGPPAPDSARFQKDYKDARQKGGDPDPVPLKSRRKTPTSRTGVKQTDPLDDNNETFEGVFWGYDGTALLCAPPRLYNMIATRIALNEREIVEVAEMARYLALVNVILADAGVAAWTAKYTFHFARPITYFRNNDPDHFEDGVANRDWTPLGAPVSNGAPEGANLTPPFPSYPSGHAVFGGALFQALRRILPNPEAGEKFKFVSDEYNGLNRGPRGDGRPLVERQFDDFADAEMRNARSRIYLGIHWQFDAEDGIEQGHKVADFIVDKILKPI